MPDSAGVARGGRDVPLEARLYGLGHAYLQPLRVRESFASRTVSSGQKDRDKDKDAPRRKGMQFGVLEVPMGCSRLHSVPGPGVEAAPRCPRGSMIIMAKR